MSEIILTALTVFFAGSKPPLTEKVKREPQPLGQYSLARAFEGLEARPE